MKYFNGWEGFAETQDKAQCMCCKLVNYISVNMYLHYIPLIFFFHSSHFLVFIPRSVKLHNVMELNNN